MATVRAGIKTVPHVQEIVQMFPGAPKDHSLQRIDKPNRYTVHAFWHTRVYFGGRYEFIYEIQILANYKTRSILKTVSPPKIQLREVDRIFDSGHTIDYSTAYNIGEEDWGRIVAAKGDFSVIGIHLRSDPVPGFDGFVAGMLNSGIVHIQQ